MKKKSALDSFKMFFEEMQLPQYMKKRPKLTIPQIRKLRIF